MSTWKKQKAIGILRKSSKRQENNSSFTIQEDEIRKYCKKNGLVLQEPLQELVESAQHHEGRVKYNKILKKAKSDGIIHHVYYMADREARNLISNEISEESVKAGELILHYARDNKYYDKNTPEADFLVRDINAATNKHFCRTLSNKTKDALIAKAQEGWFPGNRPPLGYVHCRLRDSNGREIKGRTTIEIDSNLANLELVKREFELRAQGMSYEEIRRTINSEGLLHGTTVNKYYSSSIERRLNNKFYSGYFDWFDVEYEGKHQQIIPTDVLKKVQSGQTKRGWNRKEKGVLAGGWLKCGDPACGCSIVYDGKKKKLKSTGQEVQYHYYRCTNAKKIHENRKGKNMSESEIFAQFGSVLKCFSINEIVANRILSIMNEISEKNRADNERRARSFVKALDSLNQDQDDAYADFKKNIIDEEQYRRLSAKIKQERETYQHLIKSCDTNQKSNQDRAVKKIIELATNAESLWKSRTPVEKVDFLKQVVSNPVLEGVNVRYELKKPFGVLSQMNKKEDWRPLRDSNPCLLRERELS